MTTTIKRNNPGNIRPGSSPWQGEQTRPGSAFCEFVTLEYGARAMLKLLSIYMSRHGLRTITKIVKRWAPPSENQTKKYINFVSMQTGFRPHEQLKRDADTLIAIAMAMTKMEHGKYIDREVFEEAYAMI